MRVVFYLALALAAAKAAPIFGAEPTEIPLKEIWALDMPGTRDIQGIDLPSMPQSSFTGWGFDEFKNHRQQVIEKVRRALAAKSPSEDALTGFVVPVPPGMDLLTVLNNQIVGALASDKTSLRKNPIRSDQDAFLVFYSHPSSFYVRLTAVKRLGNRIDVEYLFEPHHTMESTAHFALIPLGKLQAGEYEVRAMQRPMDQKYIDAGFILVTEWQAKRYVSRSFSFTVYDPPAQVTTEDSVAERIPLDRIWALAMPGTIDVREFEDAARIRRLLTIRTDERAKAGPCFLVRGEGEEALRNAASVLVDGTAPEKSLPADENLSLMFYSYSAPGYVRIHSVRHDDHRVTVRYQVVTHQSSEATVHFALIPLGKLPAGKFTVEAIEVASDTPYSNHALTNRAACDSCAFTIEEGARK